MSVYRMWYCNGTGRPKEIIYDDQPEEAAEPVCAKCGASPSSDPKHTISYRDQEEWDE
jgi:hypothetical protein